MDFTNNNITLNPIGSTPHLVLMFLLLAGALAWLSWKSTTRLRPRFRVLIVACRLLLIAALLALALNPGRWVEEHEESETYWSVLVDRSRSMETPDGGDKQSRWETGVRLASQVVRLGLDEGEQVQIETHTFDAHLQALKVNDLTAVRPEGANTDLVAAVDSLLGLARNRRGKFNGAIVFTDGRQTTTRSDVERIALRARAGEAPFFIVPIGGDVETIDMEVRSARRQFVAFAGQDCTVTAKVIAKGLGAIRPELVLLGPGGKEINRRQIELQEGEEVEVKFRFPAPEPGVYLYHFKAPLWEGERIEVNNSAAFTLSVIDGKTKIFMAEGAPYWDSKFLAQMIRRQKNMQIVSVYRISSDRYFRVETGDELPSQETENIFPSTADELGQYDLIVFGKGADYFLDEKRVALLSEYVRDRGGSVIFTRGKPYRERFEALEFLEPVRWGEKISKPFLLHPTAAGEASGLFGELLPGPDDPIWDQLPMPEEAHQILELKPFTEILLEGSWQLDGRKKNLPILLSRRFGRGMVATLNVDGLWKWDFFPSEDDEGLEGQYEKFWSQLIQWAVTYSEFLPGQDLSLHLDQSVVRPGQMIRARIGYRGRTDAKNLPEPALKIFLDDKEIRQIPAVRPSKTAARWEAGISLNTPGTYRIQALDLKNPQAPGPNLPITVLPPLSETEKLSADPDFLKNFAETTGGRLIEAEELPEIVSMLVRSDDKVDRSKAVWQAVWDRWWCLPILLFIASVEWFTRRRSGLL